MTMTYGTEHPEHIRFTELKVLGKLSERPKSVRTLSIDADMDETVARVAAERLVSKNYARILPSYMGKKCKHYVITELGRKYR